MARMYTVAWQGTVTNAGGDCDLWEFAPADDKPIRLRGFLLSQTSEVGDTAEEGLRISVIRLPSTFTSGSGGSAPTPAPLDETDAAAGFTAETNNTTVATTNGTAITLAELAWNERISPYEIWFPDERYAPQVRQGAGLVIRMQTTPADDYSFCGTAWVEEL